MLKMILKNNLKKILNMANRDSSCVYYCKYCNVPCPDKSSLYDHIRNINSCNTQHNIRRNHCNKSARCKCSFCKRRLCKTCQEKKYIKIYYCFVCHNRYCYDDIQLKRICYDDIWCKGCNHSYYY